MSNATPVEAERDSALYLKADKLVAEWMQEYKRHLLDGDPNIVHPKAQVALILAIVKELQSVQPAQDQITSVPIPDRLVTPKPRSTRKSKASSSGDL